MKSGLLLDVGGMLLVANESEKMGCVEGGVGGEASRIRGEGGKVFY